MAQAEVIIVGGGIVGLATAFRLLERFPRTRVTLLEKEKELAQHQSGHNSGVLHSGIYYTPSSLKASNCREGKKALEAFCDKEGIPYEVCGKVIVAVEESELPALDRLYERGRANGVRCTLITRERLKELEPHAAGLRAIHVPEAGIVDFREVCRRLAERVTGAEGRIVRAARVRAMRRTGSQVVVESSAGPFAADYVVTCAGLQSDRVTQLSGEKPTAQIMPFRGEYYALKPTARHLCRNLIYPVPDARFPFLGVHFTRMIHGGVECGPNAVLAFAREGYTGRDINLRDLVESVTYPGFLRLARRYWRVGMGEMWRSLSTAAFVRALQRLVPEITAAELESAPAGVRAQALAPDGRLVEDFLIQETDRVINVCNAPSPAATASLSIGALIVERLATRFA